MVIKEYGKSNKDIIMLLHGGGLSWWNYKDVSELLKDRFHVILPILDGHADSDRKFTSIEDNADEIINFINDNYNVHISFLGGLSLGGQVLLEILPNYFHGNLSINNPTKFVKYLEKLYI